MTPSEALVMHTRLLLSLALLTACGPKAEPVLDADGDGILSEDDCDDANPAVGLPPAWYADADGDGYGVDEDWTAACAAPTGHAAMAGDCDDAEVGVHPSAPEHCDGVDEDCDGRTDEAAVDAVAWYLDADGDGFGTTATSVRTCEAPAAHVSDAGDCFDGHAAIHPGAPELCDGWDNDCDDLVDEDPVDAPLWYVDDDGDGFGSLPSDAVTCTAPEGTVAEDGDCDDADEAVHPDAPERCDGLDNDCVGGADQGAIWLAEGDSLQETMDAAPEGGWICVPGGTYTERLKVVERRLTVEGEAGETVVIDAEYAGSVVWAGDHADLTLRHLELVHGRSSVGSGVRADRAWLTLRDVRLADLAGATAYGTVLSADRALIDASEVTIERVGVRTGGIINNIDSTVILRDATVRDVRCELSYGCEGTILSQGDGSRTTLDGVAVTGLVTPGDFYPVRADTESVLEVRDLEIRDSEFGDVTALFAVNNARLDIDGLIVADSSWSVPYPSSEFVSGAVLQVMGGMTGIADWRAHDVRLLRNTVRCPLGGCPLAVAAWGPLAGRSYARMGTLTEVEVVDNLVIGPGPTHLVRTERPVQLELAGLVVAGNRFADAAGNDTSRGAWFDMGDGGDLHLLQADLHRNAGGEAYVRLRGDATATITNTSISSSRLREGSVALVDADADLVFDYGNVFDLQLPDGAPSTAEPFARAGTGEAIRVAEWLEEDPLYQDVGSDDPSDWDLRLQSESPLVDAGSPTRWDRDGSRSDIGAYGGSHAR